MPQVTNAINNMKISEKYLKYVLNNKEGLILSIFSFTNMFLSSNETKNDNLLTQKYKLAL